MKRINWWIVPSLMLLAPAFGVAKDKRPDPRIKQVHTVFVKDEHNEASQAAQANLEKWTCFKAAPNEGSADAVISVLRSKESKSTPDVMSSIQAASERPLSIGQNLEYHTALVVNVREGSKLKKIWSKSISLGESDEQHKSGITRLMEDLKTEACSQR